MELGSQSGPRMIHSDELASSDPKLKCDSVLERHRYFISVGKNVIIKSKRCLIRASFLWDDE